MVGTPQPPLAFLVLGKQEVREQIGLDDLLKGDLRLHPANLFHNVFVIASRQTGSSCDTKPQLHLINGLCFQGGEFPPSSAARASYC